MEEGRGWGSGSLLSNILDLQVPLLLRLVECCTDFVQSIWLWRWRLINRHIKVAATIVDEGHDFPEVKDDVFWNSPKSIDEDKQFVPNHDEGMVMEYKIKSIAEIVVDERQGGNCKKSSFASRSESRDMSHWVKL